VFEAAARVKTTQITYPKLATALPASQPLLPSLPKLKLVAGDTPAEQRIHHLRDGAVVLYRRSRSSIWQVRYRLANRHWHRSTTGHRELHYAQQIATTMYDRARFREEMGLPQRTRRFGAAAAQCLRQLEEEIEQGLRPMTNRDYQRVIRKYLVPFFGKYKLTSIDAKLVREFEIWRNQQIGHMPIASTLATHCAAYNRVIQVAVEQGWHSAQSNTARLSRRGAKSRARPGFTVAEIHQLLAFMPTWCEGGHRHTGRQINLSLWDYVELLLTTGMRCGKESMNMLWRHIEWHTGNDQRYLRIWVSGKTGGRWLIAKHRAASALERLAQRQRSVSMSLPDAIAAQLPQRVFTLDDGSQPYGLAGTFQRMLAAAGLSRDRATGQQRTLYSLRHTYATMELMSGTDIYTLARQMGTSVIMLERHYSKLTATMAAQQLA